MKTKKKHITYLIGVGITIIFVILALIRFVPFERLEMLLYDLRYQLRGKAQAPGEIVVVGIDDRSLEKIGRWPWNRNKVADLIDRIHAMGARVIMLDIIFAEPSSNDDRLADAIKRAGNVALPVVFDFAGSARQAIDDALLDNAFMVVKKENLFRIHSPITAKGVLLPIEKLSANAAALGHINMLPDPDGKLRWEALVVSYMDQLYPSIDLQTARLYKGLGPGDMAVEATNSVILGKDPITTDPFGRMLIPYYGPHNTFPVVSALDVFEKKIDPSSMRGKIVLVGPTAVGIHDVIVTPSAAIMFGVEKHANMVGAILEKKNIRFVGRAVNILIIIFTGLIFTALIVRMKAIAGVFLAAAFICVLFGTGYVLFFSSRLWIDISYAGNAVLVTYFVVTAFRYATEERYARQIRSMFSSYVTEKIVNELIKNPDMAKLGGERREVTVLFSDVKGFTTFSEHHSPEEVVAILNEYLTEMTNIILRWDGTLDKFVGDMIVAFWGAPLHQENHAELAIKCTLHMKQRLKQLKEGWVKEGRVPLEAGFGLNTGEVLVGNIGAEGKKMDYTVIGDNVNLGSRVEGLTRKYNAEIILTEATLAKVRDLIEKNAFGHMLIRGLDIVAVKGKAEPVRIYEVASLDEGSVCEIIECEEKEATVFKEK
ncbi:MAG TPA: adenylate/guanylate cyclase domain-containing protein [Syntrophorhabdaceae bacterium]|nr:adenylate/guanylate cyclase domain-containing protein [Syntrophorhabdaceae bacterium]